MCIRDRASPMADPAANSSTAVSSSAHHGNWSASVRRSDNAVTRMTTGASLKPDSASSSPANRRGRGTLRNTENTAAASVDDLSLIHISEPTRPY